MFERIKAYKNLRRFDNFLKGARVIAKASNDDEMLLAANDGLYKNEVLRNKILFNRKLARKYNLEVIRKGF